MLGEHISSRGAAKPALPPITGAPPETPHHILGLRGSLQEQRQILSFAMRDGLRLPPLLALPPMPAIAGLAYDLQNVPRKVSGEPYFKHVLRMVILVSEAAATLGLPYEDIRVLTAAAYLHDSLELQRIKLKTGYSEDNLLADLIRRGMDEPEAVRTVALVSIMTPPREGKTLNGDFPYLKYKVINFEEKFLLKHPDSRLLRLLKAADLTANLEETVDDIILGREDHLMGRPLAVRLRVFQSCIAIIELKDPGNPLLPQLREEMKRWRELD